ncbi:hypothetical protein [Phosphitispora fastidiosa]|uniref:hypothetical protein n=1 Tax=Phosphitispora fastidiosa TaxID=2837202 RepID=UPI001E2F14B2|nr:hypothetical protein [Phosphitispora fastidiosa]MBU7008378.1 hypothetical protein [Phosphitispora fastidiosa]
MLINTRENSPVLSACISSYKTDTLIHTSVGETFYCYVLLVNNTQRDIEILDIKPKDFSDIKIARIGAIESKVFPPDIDMNAAPEEQNFIVVSVAGNIEPNEDTEDKIRIPTGRVIFLECVSTSQDVVNPRKFVIKYKDRSVPRTIEIDSNISGL